MIFTVSTPEPPLRFVLSDSTISKTVVVNCAVFTVGKMSPQSRHAQDCYFYLKMAWISLAYALTHTLSSHNKNTWRPFANRKNTHTHTHAPVIRSRPTHKYTLQFHYLVFHPCYQPSHCPLRLYWFRSCGNPCKE